MSDSYRVSRWPGGMWEYEINLSHYRTRMTGYFTRRGAIHAAKRRIRQAIKASQEPWTEIK